MKSSVLILVAMLLAVAPQLAQADVTTTFNTNAAGGNGFYNGSGNSDGDFTTINGDFNGGNNILISLRGAQRFVGPIAPNGSDYTCSPGEACNYEFSVATTGAFDVGDFAYNLTVQDFTQGTSFSYDPTAPGTDNSYWKGGKELTTTFDPTASGFENSEFLGFSFLGLNWQPTDSVAVTLSAVRTGGDQTDPAAEITFNAPEPSSVTSLLTFAGFLGLAGYTLKRRRQA